MPPSPHFFFPISKTSQCAPVASLPSWAFGGRSTFPTSTHFFLQALRKEGGNRKPLRSPGPRWASDTSYPMKRQPSTLPVQSCSAAETTEASACWPRDRRVFSNLLRAPWIAESPDESAMKTRSFIGKSAALLALTLCTFHTTAEGASLQRVDDWGASGVPETVSMYLYVPDNLASPAPILVLVHFCGGSAGAVFGQAQGGGLVAAADQHGFILVVPQAANPDSSGRCWDVGSSAALSREGGGDTQAIHQMVQYTLREFSANADRVYVTGTSSGGMTTQALLALYPDVFKAGSAMAGVPAGCWAVNNPGGGWSGPCAGGNVIHSATEWGDIARQLHPGYSGHRPRVQLFHGDDDDIILYQNHLEAIKQWTNVLGLSEAPTSSESISLGSHQATRQRWQDDCGYVVLDAFTSHEGDHGPSDALFLAEYLVPFLGLDDPGTVDPHILACPEPPADGSGGNGTGGTSGESTGGGSSTGGSAPEESTGGSLGGPATGGNSDGGEEQSPPKPSSKGGCGVGAHAPSPLSWWALVALFLVRARRVRRP